LHECLRRAAHYRCARIEAVWLRRLSGSVLTRTAPEGRAKEQSIMRDIFYPAFKTFLLRERENILNRVSERNLCARVAFYLEQVKERAGLVGYHADPEYNRMQDGRIKLILDENGQEVSITCDLILHSRGAIVGRDNLIAIEVKKWDQPPVEKEKDRVRLRALTKASYDEQKWVADGGSLPEFVCGYELGVYVELDIPRSRALIEEYERGEMAHRHVISWGASAQ